MCLIWFAYRSHPGYRLLLAANRDEFFARPTAPLAWRDGIAAGWDEEGGGTWLGVNRLGHLAALTNYRDPARQRQNPPSRGEIIPAYLRSGQTAAAFLQQFRDTTERYNPFNLLLFDGEEMFFYANTGDRLERVAAGGHALSNSFLDADWPKTRRVKELLPSLLAAGHIDPELCFMALRDRHQPPDEELPKTGVAIDRERMLAPVFITSPMYGSRSSAVVAIKDDGQIDFYERTYEHKERRLEITDDRHLRL
jgi:uncharacterized protein with NRDE domain